MRTMLCTALLPPIGIDGLFDGSVPPSLHPLL